MNKIILLIILLSFHAQALDLNDWKKSLVKIRSFPCLTNSPMFEGSAFLFQIEGEIFAVTSEHVLINDKSNKTCHKIENDFLGTQSAELIDANYEKGLALLKVNSVVGLNQNGLSNLLTWENLNKPTLPSHQVTALGYPFHSKDLQILNGGQLQSDHSRRALIMGMDLFLEATQLPVEYGMSGGILLNSDDFSPAGLISHQYLKRQAGKPSSVEDIGNQSNLFISDLALLIPFSAVIEFVEKKDVDDHIVRFKRSSKYQLKAENVISYGVLNFKFSQKLAQEIWGTGGADGSGVGGADGSGVGGSASAVGEMIGVVEVSLDSEATSEERSIHYQDVQLEQWKNILLRGQKVFITNLKLSSADNLEKLFSLDQFFTLWRRDKYEPIVIKSLDNSLDQQLKKMFAKARKIELLAQRKFDTSESSELKYWFKHIRDQVLLFENNLVDKSVIQNLLLNPNKDMWNLFYQTDFDSAVELESAIQDFLLSVI